VIVGTELCREWGEIIIYRGGALADVRQMETEMSTSLESWALMELGTTNTSFFRLGWLDSAS